MHHAYLNHWLAAYALVVAVVSHVSNMNTLPQYCCAIISQQEQGQQSPTIIMEQRPDSARYAPGRLCCFGGARETHEDPMGCIQRELREELSWTPSALSHVHTLHRGQQCIAWFYHCTLDRPLSALSCEAGRSIISVDLQQLHLFSISNWHRLVLDNYLGSIADSDLLTIHE